MRQANQPIQRRSARSAARRLMLPYYRRCNRGKGNGLRCSSQVGCRQVRDADGECTRSDRVWSAQGVSCCRAQELEPAQCLRQRAHQEREQEVVAKHKSPKMVRIEWVDSARPPAGWDARKMTVRPVKCVSVGMVHEETKRHITLAGSYTPGQVAELFAIPRSCIKSMKELK